MRIARQNAFQSINKAMVEAYWLIGKRIVEEEQQGESRAEYGKAVIKNLSEKLTEEFGKGFSARNLEQMRLFYLEYPIQQTLSAELQDQPISKSLSRKSEKYAKASIGAIIIYLSV